MFCSSQFQIKLTHFCSTLCTQTCTLACKDTHMVSTTHGHMLIILSFWLIVIHVLCFRPFTLNDLDDYETHFTVMKYKDGVELTEVKQLLKYPVFCQFLINVFILFLFLILDAASSIVWLNIFLDNCHTNI